MQNLQCLEPKKILLIGASTGGPGQIEKIVEALGRVQNTSVVIAQHIAVGFMQSFAKSLQERSKTPLLIAEDGDIFRSEHIYLCEGETRLDPLSTPLRFLKKDASAHSYNPNINLLFDSFRRVSDDFEIVAVLLTGIGDDGVDACKNLTQRGVRCITESHESAIVDGMPSRARERVPNIEVASIEGIIEKLRAL